MGTKKLKEDERGVSVILGAILLLGIIVLTFPVIYYQHVQSNMASNEEAQMGNVKDQFLELKSKISYLDGPSDDGEIKIPMSADSVALFPGQSPAGTITTTKGQPITNKSVTPGSPTKITINPESIRFKGRNLFYPDQTYIYQAGHVILHQDDTNFMVSKNEDLITYNEDNNNLEIKYPVPNKERSVSSTGTETITLSWGGKTRYPENKELETSEGIEITFKTEYEKTWENYLRQKDKNITGIDFNINTNDGEVTISNSTKNITYYVSSTKIGGEVTTPTVQTLNVTKTWLDAATLKMSYNFSDYAEGETRFQYRTEDGSWSSTGWETQYGTDDNHTRTILNLKSNETYAFRAQIRYNNQVKTGVLEFFETTGLYYGGGNEDGGDETDSGGTINPGPGGGGLFLKKTEVPNNMKNPVTLTLKNTGSNKVTINKTRVGVYSTNNAYKWGSNITDQNPSNTPHDIGGDFINTISNDVGEILPDSSKIVEIYFALNTGNLKDGEWFMYQVKLNSDARYTYFAVPDPG